MAQLTLNVNGKARSVDVDPDTPLLWVLRDTLGMTGTKYGCGMALCGSCTVHVDGEATRSCSIDVESVQGKRITTIEGLSPDGSHPLQTCGSSSWAARHGRCGSPLTTTRSCARRG